MDRADWQDVGVLLLRTEPFVFNGTEIPITENVRRSEKAKTEKPANSDSTASSLSFAPRAARRGGKVIGKPRDPVPQAQHAPKAENQDFFRNLVSATNKERAEGSKRKAEDDSSPSKRQKAE